jgi:beta-glucosidase
VGTNGGGEESEGWDRGTIALPRNQDALVSAIVAANPRTVVVLYSGGLLQPGAWVSKVPAMLYAYYPGNEGGMALAEILYGDVNPSGHLPDTIGKKREDYSDYPFYGATSEYKEGIYVGYRGFDKKGIEPLFCFGHGLSYTTFKYSNLQFAGSASATAASSPDTLQADGKLRVTVDVENTGKVAGEEVVQLYVHDPQPKLDKAPKELKGFTRVALKPGEKKPVTITIDARSLSYFDEAGKQWKADAGVYEIQVGASSRDIRQTGRIKLAHDWTEAVPGAKSFYTTP